MISGNSLLFAQLYQNFAFLNFAVIFNEPLMVSKFKLEFNSLIFLQLKIFFCHKGDRIPVKYG